MCYPHFEVCIFVTATFKFAFFVTAYGNNIPIIPFLLPPRFAVWSGTNSAPRVASRLPRRSRSTRRSRTSSEAPLLRRCHFLHVLPPLSSLHFLLPRYFDVCIFVTAMVTTFRSFRSCYPLVLQLVWQQARPRGWHRNRRGVQDQHDDHYHQVRLLFYFVASV